MGPLNFQSVNVALSHRPEIWNSTLQMYSSFPLIGLGQGAFYRLGSIEGFSSSDALIKLGGNGAHNYFLQTFVELGPIGLVLGLLIALPFVRLGRRNFSLVSFYALVGVALGNIYAHSLLVREMLMLAAIFAGAYMWEATALAGRPISVSRGELRVASLLVVGLLLAGTVEVARSFDRAPFKYGLRCYEERPLGFDAWTQGTFRLPIPPDAIRADMTLLADRRDLAHRPLDVQVRVVDEGGTLLLTETLRFENWKEAPREITLPLAIPPDRKAVLEIRPSHCYVPLNVGRGHDSRHLGVRVNKLSFLQSDS
jgi:hypothetical protein